MRLTVTSGNDDLRHNLVHGDVGDGARHGHDKAPAAIGHQRQKAREVATFTADTMAGQRPQHGECDDGGTSAENNDAQGGGGHQHAREAAARAREAARPREEWQQTRPTQARIRATRTALLAYSATATAAATLTDGDAREQSDDAAQHALQHGHGSEHSVSTSALRTPTRTASVVVGPRRDCNTDDGHAHEYNVARQDAHGRSYKKGAQTAPAWSLEWLLARRRAYNINWLRPRERQGRTRSQHGVGNGHSTAVVSQTAAGSSLSSRNCSWGAVWAQSGSQSGSRLGSKSGSASRSASRSAARRRPYFAAL